MKGTKASPVIRNPATGEFDPTDELALMYRRAAMVERMSRSGNVLPVGDKDQMRLAGRLDASRTVAGGVAKAGHGASGAARRDNGRTGQTREQVAEMLLTRDTLLHQLARELTGQE